MTTNQNSYFAVYDESAYSSSADRVGGLPTHILREWPLCEACSRKLVFAGQFQESKWFDLSENRFMHFYCCYECREVSFRLLPHDAQENADSRGVSCDFQPKRGITWEYLEDPFSLDEFLRDPYSQKFVDLVAKNPELGFADKIGGIFVTSDWEAPIQNECNYVIARFQWDATAQVLIYRDENGQFSLSNYV